MNVRRPLPRRSTRRWRTSGARSLAVLLVATMVLTIDASTASAGTATLERVVDASAWHDPSSDPSGISLIGSSNRFVVVDSEIEETGLWNGANVWLGSGAFDPSASWSSRRWTDEPTDVAMPSGRRVYISDDTTARVIAIASGPDRVFGTGDDRATGFYTEASGCDDPEGMAYGDGSIYLACGDDQRVVEISPGRDGHLGTDDDDARRFSTAAFGLTDPEGVAFLNDNLFVVSREEGVIVQTTRTGALLDSYDISSSGIFHPSGIAVTDDGGALTSLVTDRGVDNGAGFEDDGRIYVFSLAGHVPEPTPAALMVRDRFRPVLLGIVDDMRDLSGTVDLLLGRAPNSALFASTSRAARRG